jgi:lipoprotein-anchoring transpeptidase ErfK/SrfK
MRRICVCALLMSALTLTAFADPLQITPEPYNAAERQSVPPQPPSPGPVPAYAATRSNLGGGFIEFLFGGAAREQPVPRAYQPAPAGYQPLPPTQAAALPGDPGQGYASPTGGDAVHPPVDAKFDRQSVAYDGNEQPGTIVIDTPHKFLYLVENNGKAMRYGIGVGRPGFTWAGVKSITAKHEWPDWRPPDDMLARRPDLPRFMAGGPENPLGARAMYLGSTLYRIHGSNEPWTIGGNVSSGCIRMRNEDVIDLYDRVKVGTKVVVM